MGPISDQQRKYDAEIARRRHVKRAKEAATSLAAWAEFGPPTIRGPMKLWPWQRDLCTRLDTITEMALRTGEASHEVWIWMFDAPPQEGKSEIISRRWVSQLAALGLTVSIVSYGASLAEEHSRAVRAMLRGPEALEVWPHLGAERPKHSMKEAGDDFGVPSPDPSRADGRVLARGRDGALTGRSMNVIVVDDMYKDAADYRSAASQAEVDMFLRTSVMARLLSYGGHVVCMGTRWGTMDAHAWFEARRVELESAGLQVRIVKVSYPLTAEAGDDMGRAPGEYISPRWNREKEQAAVIFYGRHAPAVLYGKPTADGGNVWERSFFRKRYKQSYDEIIRFCDTIGIFADGASTGGGGDHTVIQLWGFRGADCYRLKQWRGQWAFQEFHQTLLDAIKRYRPAVVGVENTSNGRPVSDLLEGQIMGFERLSATGDKLSKWDPVFPSHAAGNVWYPDMSVDPDIDMFVERLGALTGVVKKEVDDEADTVAMAIRWRLAHYAISAGSGVWDALAEASVDMGWGLDAAW